MLEELKKDFRHVCEYTSRGRVKISIMNTEFCVFSLDNHRLEEAIQYNFTINDQTIKHDSTPKLLGVTLDEKINFELHTEKLEQKAFESSCIIKKGERKQSDKCEMYTAAVQGLSQPTIRVCSCSMADRQLCSIGKNLILGVPGTAGLEALEVEAGIKPLEIRREELSVRQAIQIMMKRG